MRTLLDTCVLSELLRPDSDPQVVGFVEAQDDLIVSAIVFHELLFGMNLPPDGQRKKRLGEGISAFQVHFRDRIVPVDTEVARVAAQLCAHEVKSGFDADGMDSLVAASSIVASARLATRNTKDFVRTGLLLVNPWTP
jgi:toxin FitB